MAGTCPPPGSKFQGDIPPEIAIFKEHFMHVFQHFQIFHYFPNKVAETRGEIGIWGWVVLIHLNLSPQSKSVPPSPSGKFVATPLSVNIQDFWQILLFVTFEILNKDHKKHPIPKTHNLCAPSFVLSPKRSSALYLLSEIIRRSPRPGNGDLLHCRRLPRSGPSQHISWTSAHADFVSKARRPTHLLPSNSRVNSVRPPSVRAAATGQGHQGRRSPPRRSASPYLTSDPAPRPGPPFSR